jgi:sigma-B regulation protein RsbU (phosphoserine phosphatase)
MKHRRTVSGWVYPPILILLALAAAFQVLTSRDNLLGIRVYSPFVHGSFSPVILDARPAARAAGIAPGDRVVRLDGQPYTGFAQYFSRLRGRAPGDSIAVTVERAGAHLTFPVPLEPRVPLLEAETLQRVLALLMYVLVPLFSLLLGSYMVLSRPNSRETWIFLGLLAGFAQSFRDAPGLPWDWPAPWGGAAFFVREVISDFWPIGMLLIGALFAGGFPVVRIRRAACALAAVMLLMSLALNACKWRAGLELTALEPFARPLSLAAASFIAFRFFSIGFFFSLLQWHHAVTTDADRRRRIRILLAGAYASLSLPLLYVLLTWLFPAFSEFPALRILVMISFALFPASFAYAVLVHRAVDLQVVVRGGLQYAMARGGVRLVRALVIFALILWTTNHAEEWVGNKPKLMGAITLTIVAALALRQLSGKLFEWIDRRFFRDAYSAEHLLSEVGEQIRSAPSTQTLLAMVAERLGTALHITRVAVFLEGDDGFPLAFSSTGMDSGALDRESVTVQLAGKERRPLPVYLDEGDDWSSDVPQAERVLLETARTAMVLPVSGRRGLLGVALLGPKRSDEPYSRSEMRLLESVASQAGMALENRMLAEAVAHEAAQRERATREIEMARDVQQRLFPQTAPAVEGIDWAGRCQPAQAVGGDYFDLLVGRRGNPGIALGDVSGKGIGASLTMATVHASLRTQVLYDQVDLGEAITRLNQVVYESSARGRFVTLFVAALDLSTARLHYVNAGHNPPVLVRADGTAERLAPSGIAIGLSRKAAYMARSVALEPGDCLVAFSDGISEAMNHDRVEWGEPRLQESAVAARAGSASAIVEALFSAAQAHAGGTEQNDDMTLVVLKRLL